MASIFGYIKMEGFMDLLLIIVPFILILLSQSYINSSYRKYSNYEIKSNISGSEATKMILEKYNLDKKIKISKVSGTLTDNFNPRSNVISLSSDIYSEKSIASVAVAAHECGHVLQHEEKYFFIMLRSILVPIVNFSSKFGYIIMILGVLFSALDLAMIGLIFMSLALVFQLVTLPTEFDASKRAKNELAALGIISKEEEPMVKDMLRAAAFTYLASFFANLAQMLRLFLNLRRDD